jgi:exopolysaccharide production protein ExoQ
MIIFFLYIVGIGNILINIFGQRSFGILESLDIFDYSFITNNQTIVLIGHITILAFIIGCFFVSFFGIISRNFKFPKEGLLLTFSGILLYIPVVISSLISENGGFSYRLLLFPLFIVSVYLGPRFDLSKNVKYFLAILLLIIFTSLLSILFDSSWALSNYSESWIGLPFRLYGTSSHPNSLGNIALAYLIIVRLYKKRNFWYYINMMGAIITFILAQSKSAWVALLVWWFLEWFIKKVSLNKQKSSQFIALIIAIGAIVATYFFVFQKDILSSYNFTLTGRINVWQISFDTWIKNPIFGYGPNIWDTSFRESYGFLWAGQSHNQFLQTLGESGILGFTSLIVYLIVLIKIGSRYAKVTNFASFGIIVALLVRSFFEVPFHNYGLDESFLVHALFYIILFNSANFFKKVEYT